MGKPKADRLQLLREDLPGWNEWRSGGDDPRPDLSDVDLAGCDLRGALLSAARMSGANLKDADLRDVDLRAADLSGACLDGARLDGARLQGTDLFGASLIGARLDSANLTGAGLQSADLGTARLTETDLRGTKITGANFRGARIDRARFSAAALQEASDLGADLSGALCGIAEEEGAEPEPTSDNWTLRFVDEIRDPLVPGDPRPRASPRDLLLTSYAGLGIGGIIAYATFRFWMGAESPGAPVLIGMLALIVFALLPQIAYAVPIRWLPAAGTLYFVAGGVLAGAGFTLAAWIVDPEVVLQTLAALGVMILWTPLVGASGWLRGPLERNVLLLLALTLLSVWIGTEVLGTPWVIPFLAEHGRFPVLAAEPNVIDWAQWLLPRVIAGLFLLVALTFCARQAASDWRQARLRVKAGLPRPAVWGTAAVVVSSVPMLAMSVMSFLSRSGRSRRNHGN